MVYKYLWHRTAVNRCTLDLLWQCYLWRGGLCPLVALHCERGSTSCGGIKVRSEGIFRTTNYGRSIRYIRVNQYYISTTYLYTTAAVCIAKSLATVPVLTSSLHTIYAYWQDPVRSSNNAYCIDWNPATCSTVSPFACVCMHQANKLGWFLDAVDNLFREQADVWSALPVLQYNLFELPVPRSS